MSELSEGRRSFLKMAGLAAVAVPLLPVRESLAAGEMTTSSSMAVPSSIFQSPEFVDLYNVYTGGPTGIGANLTRMTVAAGVRDPLIVATGTDMAIFPGGGASPSVLSFRIATRGFKELASVSHFGPALGSIVNMYALDPSGKTWRKDAERLSAAIKTARGANSAALWRDKIAVVAYEGREDQIASMVDYACAVTLRYLDVVLNDQGKLTPEFLQREYLEAKGNALGATVPVNDIMIATFFLAALDISHRVLDWFKQQEIDWDRAMVLIAGQQGRPTAGVTLSANSVAQMISGASEHKLALDRIYIAPFAKGFVVKDPNDVDALRAYEESLRTVWFYTKAVSNLAPTMFADYARYSPGSYQPPIVTKQTKELNEMPLIHGPDDMLAMTTRLRLVLEDPRQLLSGCVTDFAVSQLVAANNDFRKVTVPGLDTIRYPQLD